MKLNLYTYLLSTIFILCSCSKSNVDNPNKDLSLNDFASLHDDALSVKTSVIREEIGKLRKAAHDTSFVDIKASQYYDEKAPFLWITLNGKRVDDKADTLIARLEEMPQHGIQTKAFRLESIKSDLAKVRSLQLGDEETMSDVLARLEYRLTKAYMRYCCGMRYGFINPRKLFNQSEKDEDDNWKYLYDTDIELPNEEFISEARKHIFSHSVDAFTRSILPASEEYAALKSELAKDEKHGSAIRANLERLRWREKQEKGDRYVFVNVASFSLIAVDRKKESTLEMKVCCGQRDHKTPLLNSAIKRIDINPYWLVPHNIIKREIVPNHTGDTGYFARNNMKIISKTGGEEVSPVEATAEMLLSGKYYVRQEKGEGNSLGRMIFRFPNKFSVYLHDTTNKGAFERSWRGVSHGCIRLEKPFDLAHFLIGDDDENLLDRIRVAIDMTPETDYGRKLLARNGEVKMGCHVFKESIPVFLSYRTALEQNGTMHYYDDVYGYDKLILARLNKL